MTLQLHRRDGRGGIEPKTVEDRNWRNQLQSPRWGAALPKRRLPALANPEMNPTSTLMSVLFWVALAALTFVLLLLGYSTGFWH